MSTEDDFKQLCNLSKLEIPDELMKETSKKIHEVLMLFDKLDQFDKSEFELKTNDGIKIEKSIDSLRDDQTFETNPSKSNHDMKIKFSKSKSGYILGPRI